MVLVWNQLARGDNQYVAGLVAFNSIFQILFFSSTPGSSSSVLPPLFGLQGSVVDVSVWTSPGRARLPWSSLPDRLPDPSQPDRPPGRRWYERRFLPRIGPITLIAPAVHHRGHVQPQGRGGGGPAAGRPAHRIPLTIYFLVMFVVSFLMGKLIETDYPRTTALAFTAASNNFELAIAVAIAAFGLTSPVAFAAVIGPLVEVPVLILLVSVALWMGRRWFPDTARRRTRPDGRPASLGRG